MGQYSKVSTTSLPNADANATNLAASATVTRYLRAVHVANATGGAVTWNLGVGATLTGVAGALAFGKSLPANSTDAIYFGGKGVKVDNTNVRAFASAVTSINMVLIYDETDLT